MDPDLIGEFLMDDVLEVGSDGELLCALESFNNIPPTTPGVDFQEAHSDARNLQEGGFPRGNCDSLEQTVSRKRARDEKAHREKQRRKRIKQMLLELSSVLDPARPPRAVTASILSEASILSDAAHVLVQLRNEAQELKESNEKLQEAIKDLKVEKNEIRDEKTRLKTEKERLEQQVKAMSMPLPGFMPHPIAFHPAAAYAAATQGQGSAKKAVPPFAPYPAGMAMWQWLPPAVLDTTQDSQFWSPNA